MFPILSIQTKKDGTLISQFRSSYIPEIGEIIITTEGINYKVVNKFTYLYNNNFEIQILVE